MADSRSQTPDAEEPKEVERSTEEEKSYERSTTASRSRRERQASLRNEARSSTEDSSSSDQKPPAREGSAARQRAATPRRGQDTRENEQSSQGDSSSSPPRTQKSASVKSPQSPSSNSRTGGGNATPTAKSSCGGSTAAAAAAGGPYDSKRELTSLQNQVQNLQEAIRIRDREHKQQLQERDGKIETLKSDLTHKANQLTIEKDQIEMLRQNNNSLHRKLKQEEARRVDDISKDLEISDLRRSLAELKSQFEKSGGLGKKSDPWIEASDKRNGRNGTSDDEAPDQAENHHLLDGPAARQLRLKQDEEISKLRIQVELQTSRISELEDQNDTQARAIIELKDTIASYHQTDAVRNTSTTNKPTTSYHRSSSAYGRNDSNNNNSHTTAGRKPSPVVASVVPIRHRRETPPKRPVGGSGTATPRGISPQVQRLTASNLRSVSATSADSGGRSLSGGGGQPKLAEPQHHSRGPTPRGGTTQASPGRRTTAAAGATGTSGEVSKRPVLNASIRAGGGGYYNNNNTSSATPLTSASLSRINNNTTMNTTTANVSGNTTTSHMPRASPSRVKQYVQQSSFSRMTSAQASREKATAASATLSSRTSASRPRLASPSVSAAVAHGTGRSTSRHNQPPAVSDTPVVVRPTMVTAVRDEQPFEGSKFPTTFRPTRLVRHNAWENPGGGAHGF